MYSPSAFRVEDLAALHDMIDASRLTNLVTATEDGLMATPLPLFLVRDEGPYGTLYGHLARPNPQWTVRPIGDAMMLFMGPDGYVTPSWYPSKQEHGKVVPTWNYVAVQAFAPTEFFDDPTRLREVVDRLTARYEEPRADPWAISDAPVSFTAAQLRGIVGVRLPITRLEGKRKMSQNRNQADRAGAASGLAASDLPAERAAAAMMQRD